MSASDTQSMTLKSAAPLRFARYWWLAGWLMVLFITVSCLEPPRYVPDLHVGDKLEHAGAFFGLTFWFGGLMPRRSYSRLALLMLLFGAGIEVAQGAMGWGRDMDIRDFAADSLGVAAALGFIYTGLGMWMWQIERILGLSCDPP